MAALLTLSVIRAIHIITVRNLILSAYRISNAIGLILLNMRGFAKNRMPRNLLLFHARYFGVFLFSACGKLLARHSI